jgi:hypothetical protein
MKKREIKTVMVLASVLLAIAFTGCGKQTTEDNTTKVTTNDVTSSDTEEDMQSTENIESEIVDEEPANTEEIDVYEILGEVPDYPIYFLVDTLSDDQENFMGTPYAVTDDEDSYIVTGTVKALDVIMKDTGIENMDEGDKVTSVLGTEYIVTYNDHASNGNWVGIDIEDTEGNAYRIHSSQSGIGLTCPYVYILESDSDIQIVKTYENVSFQVPVWSALVYPSGLVLNIGGEEVNDYQGIVMDDDGVIHSNDLPENSATSVYDENGNIIVD